MSSKSTILVVYYEKLCFTDPADLLDSDDSDEYDPNEKIKDEFDEDEEDEKAKAEIKPESLLPPLEDFEIAVKAQKIVPKPLPLATPDPSISPGPPDMRNAMLAGQKRRLGEK